MVAVYCFVVLENNYCLNVFIQLYKVPTHCVQSALTTSLHRASCKQKPTIRLDPQNSQ